MHFEWSFTFLLSGKHTLTLCLCWNSIHNTSDAFRWIDELLGEKMAVVAKIQFVIAFLGCGWAKKRSMMFGTRTHLGHEWYMRKKMFGMHPITWQKSMRYCWRKKKTLASGWLSAKSNWNGALFTRVTTAATRRMSMTIESVPILFVKNKNTLCHLQWNVTNSARIEIMPFDEIRSAGDFKGDQHNGTLAVAWHCQSAPPWKHTLIAHWEKSYPSLPSRILSTHERAKYRTTNTEDSSNLLLLLLMPFFF